MDDRAKTFGRFLGWIIWLFITITAFLIPVNMPQPFPSWVIAMLVSNSLAVIVRLVLPRWTALGRVLQVISIAASTVKTSLMFAHHPNCNRGSDWYNSLVPSSPFHGSDLDHTAYTKCVFSGFQLASGCISFLFAAGIVYIIFAKVCKHLDALLRGLPRHGFIWECVKALDGWLSRAGPQFPVGEGGGRAGSRGDEGATPGGVPMTAV